MHLTYTKHMLEKHMKKVIFASFLVALMVNLGLAQVEPPKSPGWFNHYGRWSVGFQGGGNMYLNDWNTKNISAGGDAFVRYAFTRHFSLGLMGGWDELDVKEAPTQFGEPISLSNSILKNKGFSGDLVAWFHLNSGKPVAPYVYVGVGAMMYKRTVNDVAWTEDKDYTTIHVPFGVGLEFALSKSIALSAEVGGRAMDKATDNFRAGFENFLGTDWYPTARVGFNMYLGDSDDDDTDRDLLTNGYEKSIGTDPNKADTDDDMLNDYEEIAKYGTNPKVADSDGDGLKDGEETITFHTSPLKADTDGDGLKDGEEVQTHRTDPLKTDTDGDGLSDGDEVTKHKTGPLKADTDGDGLNDYDEVTKHRTDPLKADTDGGTVNDGQEIAKKMNPLDPTDDVPKPAIQRIEVGKSIVLEGITFRTGKSTIEPTSETTLMEAFDALKANSNLEVEIRGYTDNVGKLASNKKLSLRRAEAVRSWLVMKGINSLRIGVAGFGVENPIADNNTPEGRQKNRRIEFFRTK
jgi:outer membrane protein OmpA-like peptidoglycan-associated protein